MPLSRFDWLVRIDGLHRDGTSGQEQRPASADSRATTTSTTTPSSHEPATKRKVSHHHGSPKRQVTYRRSSTNDETSPDDEGPWPRSNSGRTRRQQSHRRLRDDPVPHSASLMAQLRDYAYGRYAAAEAADAQPRPMAAQVERGPPPPHLVKEAPVMFWVSLSDQEQQQEEEAHGRNEAASQVSGGDLFTEDAQRKR